MAFSAKKHRKAILKKRNQQRENGFDMSFRNDKLPGYNALYDNHLRHYFENRRVQDHLIETGLIDGSGRVIDSEKNKSKLFIIEQEFKNAEKAEYWRKKEEAEMRRRVQQRRHAALEATRRLERLHKIKEDREIRRQIVHACNSIVEIPPPKLKAKKKKKKTKKKKKPTQIDSNPEQSFFLTDNSSIGDTNVNHTEHRVTGNFDNRRCSTNAESGSVSGRMDNENDLDFLDHANDIADDFDEDAYDEAIAEAEKAIKAAQEELNY